MTATVFGDFLRFYRLRLALTQEELAERTGLSVRALSDMERGRARSPHRRTVDLLVTGLELAEPEAAEFAAQARVGRVAATAVEKPGRERALELSVARGLPPVLTELTGREDELRLLTGFAADAASSPGAQLVVIHGLPGVGKSALAVEAGNRLAERFADGCLFVDMRGMDPVPLTPEQAVHRLLRGFGVQDRSIPVDPDDRFALYRSLLLDREVLLILENVASEAQVRPLLTASPGTVVLVTSRKTLAGLSAHHRLELGLLGEDQAVRLLAVVAGAARVSAEPDAARRIARLCDGVPLALLIAGNRLASRPQWTIESLAAQLADERRRLTVLAAGDLQVRAAFEISYHQLSPEAARMFRLVALMPGPETTVEAAMVLAGEPAARVEAALEELVDASLLSDPGAAGRYTCHDLLRVFARERLELDEPPEAAEAAGERIRGWLVAVATKAGLFFDPDRAGTAAPIDGPDPVPDRAAAKRWLVAEQANWHGALSAAVERGEHRKVLDLATGMYWYSYLNGVGELWQGVFEAGVAAARALGDATATAEQLNCLAWVRYALCEQPREALEVNELAVRAAVEAGDLVSEAWSWYCRASIELRLGSPAEAIAIARRSVGLFESAGYQVGSHLAMSMLGVLLHAAGEFAEAVTVNQASLSYFRAAEGKLGEDELLGLGLVLIRCADTSAAVGDVPAALDLLDEAEELFAKYGVDAGLARVRFTRGKALIAAGDLAAAGAQLVSTLEQARWPEIRIEILVLLADLAGKTGEPARAREYRVRALAECARYDAPGVRVAASRLAAELGLVSVQTG
ncbi:Helix-turn-helix domain-containing protein [Amycolatopsis xylanica]|uniref:Helix-turn-helix domain-containing protein n=1 Tax=Amycolatopsis xylanica TaxID=589385 RepID=A0A1H3PKK1_9PSEU|nr:helix-turn-helix domain-containing protein [Amycolatopsis xylanica]SDZ01570.1 Helix-turn-helix domain-containing protein [Amycolatopsis xylanica]